MGKLNKPLLIFVALLTAGLLQGCSTHPVKSEDDILNDIQTNDEYFFLYNLEITDYTIISRFTSTERMTDDIKLYVAAKCEDFTYEANYALNFLLYDDGWKLNSFEKVDSYYSASHSISEEDISKGFWTADIGFGPGNFGWIGEVSHTEVSGNRQEYLYHGGYREGYALLEYDVNIPCRFTPEYGWYAEWYDVRYALTEISWDDLCGEWYYEDNGNLVWFNIISTETLKNDRGEIRQNHLVLNLEYKVDCDKFGTWHQDSFHGESNGIIQM